MKFSRLLLLIILLTSLQAAGQIYVFISYSMNDSSLQSYYQQAEQYQAKLVMRGLKNDSFVDTKSKAAELKIVYDINPELFERYEIEQVPVIVVDNGQGEIKKVTGHLLLNEALELMGEKIKQGKVN